VVALVHACRETGGANKGGWDLRPTNRPRVSYTGAEFLNRPAVLPRHPDIYTVAL
jgi:hypothetical protein